ncbi:hypothetical protein B0H14DRAFT_3462450 [Mycena olivaceomarginata]|nr:hypothetical protein B0H14DRAFT_3462450 [Mycena olivaceomarginata]
MPNKCPFLFLSHHRLAFAIPHQPDASFHEPSRHALQLCRTSLVPANLTDENPYWELPYPFCNVFFCGYVQRGMILLGDFAVKYGARAAELGVPANDLYQALVDTVENTPPDWYTVGHQNTAWETFGYIPTDPSGSTGLPTREASRAWEELTAVQYALGDFVRPPSGHRAGQERGRRRQVREPLDELCDPSVTSNGFSDPPNACSPVDPMGHSCVRRTDNNVGFYYSFFASHSMSTLVGLMGGPAMFICVSCRADTAALIADEVLAVRLALGLARAV